MNVMTPDPTSCTFIPPSLFGDHMNVALRLELGSPGVCDDSACWVVLDSGADGWRIASGQVVLPPAICKRRGEGNNLRVAVTQLCDSKTALMPACPTQGSLLPGDVAPIDKVMTGQVVTPPKISGGRSIGSSCRDGSSVIPRTVVALSPG